MKLVLWSFSLIIAFSISESADCDSTVTTVTKTINSDVCAKKIIFEDNFDYLNMKVWRHENTLSGGGNSEFQWYTNNRTNSYVKDGYLYIKPSLTSDHLDEEFLNYGTLNLDSNSPIDSCTDPTYNGCLRTATPQNILNPIKSARLSTVKSFSFKYGKVEISAKMPLGDWLIPEILMLPADNAYGPWPASGEITLVQSRGNKVMLVGNDNIGINQISSGLHFGPFAGSGPKQKYHFTHNSKAGFNTEFHLYTFEWTPSAINFSVDGNQIGSIDMLESFWEIGEFEKSYPTVDNPWKYSSNIKIAPFDQEFYIVVGLAVGGTSNFPDAVKYGSKKPWDNKSSVPMKEFYEDRAKWSNSWKLNENDGESAAFQIDYIKVYAN